MNTRLLTLAATLASLAVSFAPTLSHARALRKVNSAPFAGRFTPHTFIPLIGQAPTGTITVWSPDWILSDGWVVATAEVDDQEDGSHTLSSEWYTHAGGVDTHLTACSNKGFCYSALPMPLQCRDEHYLKLVITDSDNNKTVVKSSVFRVYDVTCEGEIDSAFECAMPNVPDLEATIYPDCNDKIIVRNSARWAEAGPTWVRFEQNGYLFEKVVGPLAPGEERVVTFPSAVNRDSHLTIYVDGKNQVNEMFSETGTGCVKPGKTVSYNGENNNRLVLLGIQQEPVWSF
ncbi:MAG: hypothetical protein JRH20_15765 [Deltaproteobacteria bacterium]|nr:hypothetical protein [Deltaproteobacteria bacterium]